LKEGLGASPPVFPDGGVSRHQHWDLPRPVAGRGGEDGKVAAGLEVSGSGWLVDGFGMLGGRRSEHGEAPKTVPTELY